MIQLSIITVVFNVEHFLADYFISIGRSKNIEVLIYDAGSTDGSLEIISQFKRRKYPIRLFKGKNIGFAAANNFLAKKSTSDYLFILNPDTKLEKNCLKKLLGNNQKNSSILVPKQLFFNGKILSHGVATDIFGYPSPSRQKIYFYADGAAIFISKKLFVKLGMFDENYFMFQEDIDFSWRARLLGIPLVIIDASVYHYSGGSLKGGAIKGGQYFTNTLRRYLGERNNISNLIKNYSLQNLLWILPLYLATNLFEILLFLFLLQSEVSRCYLRAYAWNIKNLPAILNKRRWVQARRLVGDKEIMKNMIWGSNKLRVFLRSGIPSFK